MDLEAIYNQYRQYGSKYKPSWLSCKHLSKLAFIIEFLILSFPWVTAITALKWSKIIKILVPIKTTYFTDGKLAFCHGRKKLWTKILGLCRAKIK